MNEQMNKDIKKSFEEIGEHFANQAKYFPQRERMHRLVARYRTDVGRWYTEGDTNDANPLSTTTQEHWYSMFLERKRLDSRGIKVRFSNFIGDINPMRRSNTGNDDRTYSFDTDGRFLTCKYGETTRFNRNFIRNNQVIYQQNMFKKMDYYIISSETPNEAYICPNCGTVLLKTDLIDGCDFCGTKFSVDAFEDKVAGFFSNVEALGSREVNSGTIGWVVAAAIPLGLGIIMPIFWLPVKLIFLGIGIILTVIATVRNNSKGPASSSLVKRRIAEANPGFCVQEFLSSLDCKVKAFCYAQDFSEIEPFFAKDPEIRPKFNSVLLCEAGAYRMKEFRAEEDYQYLTLNMELNMVCEANGKIGPVKKIVKIDMRTKRHPKIKHAVTTYACENCGGTISLVEGGRCKYCGTKMNLENFDWIITDMALVDKLQ